MIVFKIWEVELLQCLFVHLVACIEQYSEGLLCILLSGIIELAFAPDPSRVYDAGRDGDGAGRSRNIVNARGQSANCAH